MIESRGPNNTLVTSRTCVPVVELCHAVSKVRNPAELMRKYQVNREEIFACIETYSDIKGPTKKDFVEFEWETVEGDVDLNTTACSDWVYLSVVTYGRTMKPNEEVFNELYTLGLEGIFTDCLNDIISGNRAFEDASDIHRIIFTTFEKSYGHVSADRAQELLVHWSENE